MNSNLILALQGDWLHLSILSCINTTAFLVCFLSVSSAVLMSDFSAPLHLLTVTNAINVSL